MTVRYRSKQKRSRRRLLIGSSIAAGSMVTIYAAAMRDMARERAVRKYLGDQLYTEIRGAGTPLVFLAGLQGSTRYWGDAFDALGFGRSPWPDDIAYTLEDHVEALHRTLVAKGAAANVTIVSHSFGTLIAARYAARYPDEVSGVVMLGTPIFANEVEARERIRKMTMIGALFMLNNTLANLSCMAMCAFRPLLQRLLPALRPRLDPAVVADSVLHDLPAIDGAVNRILLEERVSDDLKRIGAKAVLIHGRADAVTPLEDARRTAAATGAMLIEVDGNHQQYFTDGIEPIRRAINSLETSQSRSMQCTKYNAVNEEKS
ncbi:MAG TPA: alpha/beta hydrolase [Thermoanaerobaculia bacterium]|nr:alpha/beta hydrolase [Thermoanaerobaculia bacterium]